MDIEIKFALEKHGIRKQLGRAVIKDIDPTEFAPYEDATEWASHEYGISVWIYNAIPGANARLIAWGSIVPAPHEVEFTSAEDST